MGNRRKPQNPTFGPAVWMHAASELEGHEAHAGELMATLNPLELKHVVAHLLCLSAALASRWPDTEREALIKDIQTASRARAAIAKGGDTPPWTSER